MPARINTHPEAIADEARWLKSCERTILTNKAWNAHIRAAKQAWINGGWRIHATLQAALIAAEAEWYAPGGPGDEGFPSPSRCTLCDQFLPCPCDA